MTDQNELHKIILDTIADGVYLVDRDRKISFWNQAAEKITGYPGAEVLGTHCFHNLLRHVDDAGQQLCQIACPLAQTIADGEYREAEVYLHHKKGHRLPVLVRVSPVRDDQGQVIGAVEVFTDHSRRLLEKGEIEELRRLAMFDNLTGLANRRFGEIQLRAKINEIQRYNFSFGLLFMDIDQFKKINDAFGHDVGDEALRMVAQTLSHNLRALDVLVRWGGEEFVAVIAHLATSDHLRAVANKLQKLMEQSSLSSGTDRIRLTISIGATLALPTDTEESIVRRADQLMYQAKKLGGNQVSMDPET